VTPEEPATPAPARVLRPLAKPDLREATGLLEAAFLQDPLYRFLFPSERRRRGFFRRDFSLIVRFYLRHGLVYGCFERRGNSGHEELGARLVGLAVWYPPRRLRPDGPVLLDWARAAHWMLTAPLTMLRLRAWGRALRQDPVRSLPLWRLVLLAVSPGNTRKGIGTELVRKVLDRATQDKVDSYLLTDELTLSFYTRLGFQLLRKVKTPAGPELCHLIRYWDTLIGPETGA